jgi:hypothetical protein
MKLLAMASSTDLVFGDDEFFAELLSLFPLRYPSSRYLPVRGIIDSLGSAAIAAVPMKYSFNEIEDD